MVNWRRLKAPDKVAGRCRQLTQWFQPRHTSSVCAEAEGCIMKQLWHVSGGALQKCYTDKLSHSALYLWGGVQLEVKKTQQAVRIPAWAVQVLSGSSPEPLATIFPTTPISSHHHCPTTLFQVAMDSNLDCFYIF